MPPYRLHERIPSDTVSGMTRELAEQKEFVACEFDSLCTTHDGVLSGIDADVRKVDMSTAYCACRSRNGVQARNEFCEGEWLCEVIVCATVKSMDDVVFAITGG